MNCEQFQREAVEEYLLGRLSEAEREAVELHYFECRDCFEQLQVYLAVCEALRRKPGPLVWRWIGGMAAAAAVITCVFLLYPKSGGRPLPQASPLAELARVRAPHYDPAILRGTEDAAASPFQAAMQDYTAGKYAGAIAGLQRVSALDPKAPAPMYYLGISLLVSGQREAAAEVLNGLIALGDTPFLEGGHFYLAKAYLGMGKVADARQHLQEVVGLHDRFEGEARRLLARMGELVNR